MIRNDMLVVDPATLSHVPVLVLTEDKETRWFLDAILPEYIKRQIRMPEMGWGCKELAKFNQETFPALEKSLIVVDGDFELDDYKKYNLLILPGNSSPEGVIYNFLKSLQPDHELLNNPLGINKRALEEYGPLSPKYKDLTPNRKKYKRWFQENYDSLTSLNVISHWRKTHQKEIDSFVENFQSKLASIKAMRKQ